jgi:hypothetical protein
MRIDLHLQSLASAFLGERVNDRQSVGRSLIFLAVPAPLLGFALLSTGRITAGVVILAVTALTAAGIALYLAMVGHMNGHDVTADSPHTPEPAFPSAEAAHVHHHRRRSPYS